MISRILVPVDFSDVSIKAARYALDELAPQLGASVLLVTVLEVGDLRVAMKAGLHGFDNDEELHEQINEWIDEQFGRIESASDGRVKTSRSVRRGIPEKEILQAIREHETDLVVMGSTGVARRIPMGSKAEFLVRNSDVPLLLIHPSES